MDNSSTRTGVSAIVEYDYTAKEPDELTLVKGATLHHIKVQPGGWWEGTLEATGRTGMFPDNFVKVLEIDPKNPVVMRDKSAAASRRCKAVYSYTQNNNDELTLAVGDLIEFLGEVEEGWWRGKLGEKMGVFPSNFVVMEAQSPALAADRRSAAATAAAASAKSSLTASSTTYSSHTTNGNAAATIAFAAAAVAKQMSSSREDLVTSSTNDSPADAPILPPKPVRELCKVLYPYTPANDDELELREGEIIAILSRELPDKGWLKGELKGKIGVFPDNFVVLISSEASPTKETAAANSKPDRPPSTTKMQINSSKISATSSSTISSSGSTVISTTNNHSTRDSFGSRDSLNETAAAVIPSGNVAAYRKSLEKQVLDITTGPAAVAASAAAAAAAQAAAAIDKPARKSFDTKTTDFRKSLENLDEKSKGTPPPVTKKPSVPVKKSPTVSSVAGSIFSGIKSKVVSGKSHTSVDSSKSASSDSLDGIGSSRVAYNVSENIIGERIRRDNATDFDQVERGQSILQDMRAGRAKAPKRRPPTSAISMAGSSTESGGDSSGAYANNGVNEEETNGDTNDPAEHDTKSSKPAAARSWEKQKAPWMAELRANQAIKKTSPNSPDFAGKSLDYESAPNATVAVEKTTSSTSFDMSKSVSSSFVTTSSTSSLSTTSSQAVRKSTDFSAADVQLRHTSSPASENHSNSTTAATSNIMARSMSGLSTSKVTFNASHSTGGSTTIVEPVVIAAAAEVKKPRPTSVNLRNRSISPIGRIAVAPSANAIDPAAKPLHHVNHFAIIDLPPSGAPPVVTIENVCPRVSELEQKVSRLERLVQQQAQTHDELLRAFREESDKVKALRGELDKYAQCVTQV